MADAVITSFGFLHGTPPAADSVVDVRGHFCDPHLDPGLREATGLHAHVLASAAHVVQGLAVTVDELLRITRKPPVRVAVGCAGGRHRSVAIVEEVARRLRRCGWRVGVRHLHVDRRVVRR